MYSHVRSVLIRYGRLKADAPNQLTHATSLLTSQLYYTRDKHIYSYVEF